MLALCFDFFVRWSGTGFGFWLEQERAKEFSLASSVHQSGLTFLPVNPVPGFGFLVNFSPCR
jgi:hypothetical protein